MFIPILATKLYIPPPRPNLVSRPRLVTRLNEGLAPGQGFGRKLTLVSAPAGFGKTTLISEWLSASNRPAAWLSLDERDNDPTRFLTYLVAALQTVAPEMGTEVSARLQSPQPPPIEALLTALLNEIARLPHPFILVLDDYHIIDTSPAGVPVSVDGVLNFLLENLPPQLHLVIATREDPPFPLARLRARDQLAELRAADLRFTPSEAAEFLNRSMGLTLSAEDVAALESATEGWIAGLQLAALSMQGRTDTAGFVRAFTGSHRFVLDYLVEEVLQRQPANMRNFLLQTAILERMCGPLCDAVCFGPAGTPGSNKGDLSPQGKDFSPQATESRPENGQQMLAALERDNLFVVPLDDRRQWYRYHHLFADVLQAYLLAEQPEQVPVLHRRASTWYAQHELAADAIHHALAARDFIRAADLIEMEVLITRNTIQEATWLGWVKALPDELIRTRPVLNAYYALLTLPGEIETAGIRLQEAEQMLRANAERAEQATGDPAGMVVVNDAELRTLPAMIAIARAYRAGALGDIPGIVKYAWQAIEQLPEDEVYWRGAAAALQGVAYWSSGNLDAAYYSLQQGMASLLKADGPRSGISAMYLLADIQLAQGHLQEAGRICREAFELIAENEGPAPVGTADLHVVLSEIDCARGNLDTAQQHLWKSRELGPLVRLTESQHRWGIAMAKIKAAEGDLDSALNLLDEAEQAYVGGPAPNLVPIPALRARIWITLGELPAAQNWVRERGLSVADEPEYLREFEQVTLARLLLAGYRQTPVATLMPEATAFMARLLNAAEAGKRLSSTIEILILQALAHEAQDNISAALAPLTRALRLAEPEGVVRIFVDEGLPMARLLQAARGRDIAPAYLNQLLSAFPPAMFGQPAGATAQSAIQNPKSEMADPLTERELEVLQLVAQGLSNREISERLFIALSTVKGHNRIIYNKLQVNRRTEAVAQARELGLL